MRQEESHLLEYCEEVRCLMLNLSAGRVDFDEFITEKHRRDVEFGIHEEGVLGLLAEVQKEIKHLEVRLDVCSIFVWCRGACC